MASSSASFAALDNSTKSFPQVPTSTINFVESEHGLLRRMQRGIDKKDLQRAMKYGERQIQSHVPPRSQYTYDDIVYIVDDDTGKEITSYATPFQLDIVAITDEQIKEHQLLKDQLKNHLDCWTSHLVLVVDTSGSMKEADVWGARNRLQAVWLTIAMDIIATRIESGEACGTDAVSIITLSENPKVIIEEQPTTWVLYNQIATIYNEVSVKPSGHGPYLRSLINAREIFERNTCASCAMNLMFLSDGRPSIERELTVKSRRVGAKRRRVGSSIQEQSELLFLNEIEVLARSFGRRLTFQAVGIGYLKDFDTLKKMVEKAKDYGVEADLLIPSMSTAGLSDVFSSVGTSIIKTQMELTNIKTMKQEMVKSVLRESRSEANVPIQFVSSNKFSIYPSSRVQRFVYTETKVERPIEAIQFTTKDSFHNRRWETISEYKKVPYQHLETHYIALAKEPFGEGAERLAFRFFEVGINSRTILGNPMVAKDSRFETQQPNFIKTFCLTQQLSRRLANEFNEKLNKHRVDPKTPRIHFLDCSIYEIEENDGTFKELLVEDKLDDTKWMKWNSNNGYVQGMQRERSKVSHRELMKKIYSVNDYSSGHKDLDTIDEGDDDNKSEDEHQIDDLDALNQCMPIQFSPNEVAQAFSHFTYWASGRKRLVCDLQGVYDDDTKRLLLSDPVIHYHNPHKEDRLYVHGRTDKGRRGVEMFFSSHKDYCGHLCKLVLRGLKPVRSRDPFDRERMN